MYLFLRITGRSQVGDQLQHRTSSIEDITQHDRRHLHQDALTPVGHSEGYDLFRGQDRHEIARKVLEGQLEWTHPVEEVNEYIDNLQRAFDADRLQEKVKQINAVVTAGEFRHYLKTKKREY